jgi:hypothetical protein
MLQSYKNGTIKSWLKVKFIFLLFGMLFYSGCHQEEYTGCVLPEGLNRSEQINLSLRVLKNITLEAIAKNQPIPEECLNLAGIGYVEGVIIDDESEDKDIILTGRRSDVRPSLRLDDLVVLLSMLNYPLKYPYCSLDPLPEKIAAINNLQFDPNASKKEIIHILEDAIGLQKVVIGGVPNYSRFAHTMINADYHMKKVSLGLEKIRDIPSCINIRSEQKMTNNPSGVNMSRFWFHLDKASPTFRESERSIWINCCNIVLLTEKQIADAQGNLRDDLERDDATGLKFAQIMSDNFSRMTSHIIEYADLENLFRLRAILLALHTRYSISNLGFNPFEFIPGYTYQDETTMYAYRKGLANCLEYFASDQNQDYREIYMALGGVSVDMEISEQQFDKSEEGYLSLMSKQILKSRPSTNTLFWKSKNSVNNLAHFQSSNP